MDPVLKRIQKARPRVTPRARHAEDYRITIAVGIHQRHVIWNASEPFALDFPIRWVLEKTQEGFCLSFNPKASSSLERIERSIPGTIATEGKKIKVPATDETPPFEFKISRLERIRPAFFLSTKDDSRPSQTFLFYGQRESLVNYGIAGDSFVGRVQHSSVFAYQATEDGYRVTSYQSDVQLRVSGEKPQTISNGKVREFSVDEFSRLRINWNNHWWRVNQIPLSPPLPAHLFADFEKEEAASFAKLCKKAGIAFAAVAMILFCLPFTKKQTESAPTLVVLKKPKLIAGKPDAPKPKPKEIVRAAPKPKPEPVKVAKAAKPAKKAPAPKMAKIKPMAQPKPQKVAKAAPPPIAKPVATAPVRVAAPVAPRPDPRVVAAQQAAQQTAKLNSQLSKSLGFLSSNPKAIAKTTSYSAPVEAQGKEAGRDVAKISKNAKYLASLSVSSGSSSGAIETTGVRGVSDAKIVEEGAGGGLVGGGKGLNKVLGKVSLNSLYGEGGDGAGGGEMGDALGKSGISMSGGGSIDEKLIMAALAKRLDRLQYCYEKSLLSNPSLSGNIMMEWGISTSGSVSNVKVVKSQMNNSGLHSCISREIAKIPFPAAQGGTVMIKYPFNFSNTSL
jgi:hypothetical protein